MKTLPITRTVEKLLEDLNQIPLDETTAALYVGERLKATYMEAFRQAQATRTPPKSPELRKKTPPVIPSRLLFNLKGVLITARHNLHRLLYGSYERYATDRTHDPSKLVTAHCGYCGEYQSGNAVQKGPSFHLRTSCIETKHGRIEVFASTFPIKNEMHCTACSEAFRSVYLSKVSKTVWAVLL